MKLNAVLAAALTLGVAISSHAASYSVTTDSYFNSTGGGAGVDFGLSLTTGESFTVSTDAGQIWHGAMPWDGNYEMLSTNAGGEDGLAYAPYLVGIGWTAVGTLVADIGGDYRVIGAGTNTFTAWADGEIEFHYADINSDDNFGAVNSTVTTAVPEPANIALLLAGLGMMGVVARRRASK